MRPLSLAVLCALTAAPLGAAWAQSSSLSGGERLLWVPRLTGAWTFDLGVETRVRPLGSTEEVFTPEEHLRLHVGYLRYLDGHGRLAAGGYLGGGFSLGSDQQPAPPDSLRLDLGLWVRLRAINADFIHIPLGLFIEGGPQLLGDPTVPTGRFGEGEDVAWRVGAGLEMGFGLLWSLDPYLFGETLFRFGVETTHLGGRNHPAFFGGIRLNFDWAQRAGAAAANEPDPEQPPPFDPFADDRTPEHP